jgi:DNA-directed RNA polymerase specialized sigma24 family protein
MADALGPRVESKKQWALTEGAFRRLLEWLDQGEDSGGQRYLEIRRRMALYFDRKNCAGPDELADETLNRVARRLQEEGTITSDTPAHYCFITARFVFLEQLRKPKIEEALDDTETRKQRSGLVTEARTGEEEREQERLRLLECLSRCVESLDPDHRDLIVDYYTGEQRVKIDNRRAMAARLGITVNALSIRACRIRDKLEACVRKCAKVGIERG